MNLVAYYRLSPEPGGSPDEGLLAQETAVEEYAQEHDLTLLGAFTEWERGSLKARPELAEALNLAVDTGALLVIPRIGRLIGNLQFLKALGESRAEFKALDRPDLGRASAADLIRVAELRRARVSKKIKAALAAAKARGVKLGNPNGAEALRRAARGNAAGIRAIKTRADEQARALAPLIETLRAEGFRSLGALADELNRRRVATPRGGKWYKTSVRNLLNRIERTERT